VRLLRLLSGVSVALAIAGCSAPPPSSANAGGASLGAAVLDDGPTTLTAVPFERSEVERILALSPLPPPPADPTNRHADDPRAAHLGQFLFFDTRFSAGGVVSCANCHDPNTGWSDGLQLGIGIDELDRHSQTLWNAAYNRWFFWDGRADSMWSQALGPLEDPREHGGNRTGFAHTIAADPELRSAYESIFGALPALEEGERFPAAARPVADDPEHPENVAWESMGEADREAVDVVFANMGKALAAFQRKIVSRHSRFDEFVEGLRESNPTKLRSLTASAQNGLKLFLGKANCHLCHQGPNFTDREFHNTRIAPLRGGDAYDAGRYEGIALVQSSPFNGTSVHSDAPTGDSETKIDYLIQTGHNWGEFKTPSLRNVAVTAPYMHQGQLAGLRDVVRHYSTFEGATPIHQHAETILVPLNLSEGEIDDLVAFLQSLTDESASPALSSAPASPALPTDEVSRFRN